MIKEYPLYLLQIQTKIMCNTKKGFANAWPLFCFNDHAKEQTTKEF